jgi:hypothetical protein
MMLDYLRFVRGGAEITVGAAGGNSIAFTGTLREVSVGEWLNPLIQKVHAQAIGRGMSEIVVDIRELVYANAAMWTCLVGWLRMLRSDPGATYNLRPRWWCSAPNG